ncbi:DUF4199 domain-containing protein [Algoriphagus namhaensis]|uniref:DUF4199 domain-containing protein n=1 Tax=Algoriphagus namhaensis TaxID=915353 RepID=A0ABV8AT80_9BACT
MGKYFQSAYRFGTLGGVLSVVSFLALAWFYGDPTNLNLVFGYIIVPIAIFLTIKFYKDYNNDGYLSFSEGMTVGFVAYMILGLISGLGIWLILSLSPDLFELILDTKLKVLADNKELILGQVGEKSFETTLMSVQAMTPFDVGLNDTLWKIIPGLFFSIIISIILRRNSN